MANGAAGADWRGAALDRTQGTPRYFSRRGLRPQICLNGRLPRTTQGAFCLFVREINHSNRTLDKTSRWVIPGSRLLKPMFWPFSRSKEYARSLGHVPKRLPSNPAATLGRGFAAKIGHPNRCANSKAHRSTIGRRRRRANQSLITSSQSPLALPLNARPATGTGCN
jgi:hypothetical protein